MNQPLWVKSFKYLGYSIKGDDSRAAFDALMNLIGDKKSAFKIFKLVGLLQAFIVILEYFSGYNNRKGRPWRKIHSSEIIEDLLMEIKSAKRKTLE